MSDHRPEGAKQISLGQSDAAIAAERRPRSRNDTNVALKGQHKWLLESGMRNGEWGVRKRGCAMRKRKTPCKAAATRSRSAKMDDGEEGFQTPRNRNEIKRRRAATLQKQARRGAKWSGTRSITSKSKSTTATLKSRRGVNSRVSNPVPTA